MHILVVDDKVENRYLMEALLKGNGFTVIGAANGAEALEMMKEDHFDLIISDILMPVMDGFQFCRIVKSDEIMRRIPFIVYTATYTGPQDEEFAKKIGADQFIVKPCEPDVFMEIINEVIAGAGVVSNELPKEQPKEEEILKLYSERLVRKLEQKMMELEEEVLARRQTETALRESEEKHRRLFETMLQGVTYQDSSGKIIDANPAAQRILGLTLAQLQGRDSADGRWQAVDENEIELFGENHPSMTALRTGRAVEDVIMGVYNPREQARRWIKVDAIPVFKEGDNEPYQVYASFDDITERKLAMEEKQKLEEQLRQSQKMESIGRLAGGVAHDFNNLLQGILGFSEMIKLSLVPNDPLHRDINEVIKAAESAAGLTRQLLAFSRKQIITPRLVDLNFAVERSKKMLSRLIGEDIDLVFKPTADLWQTKADPAQIDQILVNLAINSRDAMPDGGKLIIETSNVVFDEEDCKNHTGMLPGEFVMLAVSDDGIGMKI